MSLLLSRSTPVTSLVLEHPDVFLKDGYLCDDHH